LTVRIVGFWPPRMTCSDSVRSSADSTAVTTSNGTFTLPSIASEGIHDKDMIEL
jgi:hypothetical protein